jgi:hypothetical protein
MAITSDKYGKWYSSLTNEAYPSEAAAKAGEVWYREVYLPKNKRDNRIINLSKQILGQKLTDKWSGEGFGSAEANARNMAEILADAGISDINQFGKWTVEEDVPYSDEYGSGVTKQTKEVFGNKITKTPVAQTYASDPTAWGGTYAGKGNTGYRVQFGPDGTPYFYTTGGSSSDLGSIAPFLAIASFIPGVAPIAAAANAAIAIDQGNVLGGLASLAGIPGVSGAANAAGLGSVVSGIKAANQVNNLVNAAESGNVLGALTAGANLTGTGGVQLGDTGYNVADVLKTANIADALDKGNIAPLVGALTSGSAIGGPKSSDFEEGYFRPGGAGYDDPDNIDAGGGWNPATVPDTTPDNIDIGGGWNPANVTPQAPELELPTVPTQEEQQPSIDALLKELEPYAPAPDDVPEMVVTAPRPEGDADNIDAGGGWNPADVTPPDEVPEMVITAPRPEDDPDNIDIGGGWNPADVPDTTPDNIDAGGGWNPADGPDTSPDNIDIGGGWNPATGGGGTPTSPPTTAKPPTATRPPATTPAQPAQPAGMDLLSLLGLMGMLGNQSAPQQPVQIAPADVKSFEEQGFGELFGPQLQFSEGGDVDALLQLLRG